MTQERHAVVTGASSGIGGAIATHLAAEGWRVTGISRTAPASPPAGYRHLALDLAEATGEEIGASLAGTAPTALVHAAGKLSVGRLGALDAAAGMAMWRLHVDAAARLADALAQMLPDRTGRIVLIGSRTAAGAAGRSQYAATKAALVGLARSWAMELAPRGVTVNVIAPGATETPMLHDPSRQGVPPRLPPIGRFINPGEVAALTAFLLSPSAGAITGQQLIICGGASL